MDIQDNVTISKSSLISSDLLPRIDQTCDAILQSETLLSHFIFIRATSDQQQQQHSLC